MSAENEIQSSTDESIDLRTALTNAMNEVQERQEEEQTAQTETETQTRTEDGKFAKKEEADKGQQEPAATETTQQEEKISAPNTWKAEAKAEWDNLPKNVQKYITEREAEIHRGFTKFDADRQMGKELRDVLSPYMAIINAEGSTPAKAVQSLMNTAYILRSGSPEQKVSAISAVLNQYGIDPSALMQNQQQQWVDPHVKTLQDRVNALEYEKQQQEYAQQYALEAQAQQAIEAFASDPANAHYETVKPDMAILLQSGRAKDMKEAYEMACWANPSVRSSLMQAQAEAANREKAAQEKTAHARKAGASLAGGPGGSSPVKSAGPERSLREELAENLRAATGGRI